MHSKRRYEICICSVILGELEPFRNYKGLSIIFPKMLDAYLTYYESEIFSDFSSMAFSNPKNFRFYFFHEKSLTREVKCEN